MTAIPHSPTTNTPARHGTINSDSVGHECWTS